MSDTQVPQGVIRDVGFVDFTGCKTEDELSEIKGIYNTGAVLVPEHLMGAAARIPMENVGQVIGIPADKKAVTKVGQIQLTAESIENGCSEDEILVLIGQIMLTGVPTRIPCEIIILGALIAPKEAQGILSGAIKSITGTVSYYVGNSVRLFMGDTTLDAEYFELLPEPAALVTMGSLTIEDDVSKELLREKVTGIILMGVISVPKHLNATVQVLTTEKLGDIEVRQERR